MKDRNPSFRPIHASLGALLALVMLLAGCAIPPEFGADPDSPTPMPTGTPDVAGYNAVETRGCRVNDWTTMQTNQEQGALIAWRPGPTTDLAFLAPSDRTSWFVGDLRLAKAPEYTEHVRLAPNVLAAGDLTWSPDGERLAFLAFRPSENVYTVMSVRADGSELIDHFPTDLARTDVRTSRKAIIGWEDEDSLLALAYCGDTCRSGYRIDVSEPGEPMLTPTPIDDYTEFKKNLTTGRRVPPYDPEDFPRVISTPYSFPHWSPGDRWVSYLDRSLSLWVLSPEEKITFPLDIGLRDVYEMQWSEREDLLAVRAEDRIFVFQVPCQATGE